MIKRIKKLLNEIHFQDKFSKHFLEFWNKYSEYPRDKSLYVTFTMYRNSTIDKSVNLDPQTHNDPVGIYTYPLEYVVLHPMDIKFAEKRKFLQVLRLKIDRVCNLQNITKEELQRCYDVIYGHDQYITNKTMFNFKTPSKMGWLLFKLIQNDHRDNDRLRSSKEQTELFLKLGYKAILDTAITEENAIINSNEPEQIIFLTRDSYEIVDIFQNNMASKWNVFGKVAEKIMGLLSNKTGMKISNKKFYDEDGKTYTSINYIDENKTIYALSFKLDNIKFEIKTELLRNLGHRSRSISDKQKIFITIDEGEPIEFSYDSDADYISDEIVIELNI